MAVSVQKKGRSLYKRPEPTRGRTVEKEFTPKSRVVAALAASAVGVEGKPASQD
jgi:hypothetical protein